MENLDEQPTKYHELHNSLHKIAGQNGVILERLKEQEKQNDRIEDGIGGLSGRLEALGNRMNDMEKTAISDKGRLEAQILQVTSNAQAQIVQVSNANQSHVAQVKSDLEKKILELTANLQSAVERLNPVRLIVFGAITIILSAVLSAWVGRVIDGQRDDQQREDARVSAPVAP